MFGRPTEPESPPVDLQALHAKIGQLTLENDFLEGALNKAGWMSAQRRSTVNRSYPAVVRNSYQPEREIQTGIGPVSVKIPKNERWQDLDIRFYGCRPNPHINMLLKMHSQPTMEIGFI